MRSSQRGYTLVELVICSAVLLTLLLISAPPLLEARGIVKYFGAITALRDVNFHLLHGEVLGVVGDNGAGKSSLII